MEKKKAKTTTNRTDTRGRSHRQQGAWLRVTSAEENAPRPLHHLHHHHWLSLDHLPLPRCLAAACGSLIGWKHTSPAHQKEGSTFLGDGTVASPARLPIGCRT